MATTVNEPLVTDRRVAERRHYPAAQAAAWTDRAFRVSWAGIWAGVLAALGTLLLLAALGLAIGITATDLQAPDAGAVGAGAAIWAGLSLLVALFVGGMLSTRLAMITDRSTGGYEGALVWAMSIILVMYLAGSGVGMLASGVFGMVGSAGRTAATVAGAPNLELTQGDVDGLIARLRAPETAQRIATATGLPVEEVRARLDRTAQAVQDVRNDPAEVAAEVRRSMTDLMSRAEPLQRLERAGQTSAWIAFLTLLLSLGAAIGGAAFGRRRAERHQAPVLKPSPPAA